MIKNIVFDMGNVLLHFDAAFYVELYCSSGSEADKKTLMQEVFQSVEWVATDRGTMNCIEAAESVCRRLSVDLHEDVYKIFTCWHHHLTPVPGMESLIRRLKNAGFRIYLLSNTSTSYPEFREKIPALDCFDGEFVSAAWRTMKPSKDAYRGFCSHFQLVPAECVFIDDLAVNIEGAMFIGMDGIIFRGDPEQLEKDLTAKAVVF